MPHIRHQRREGHDVALVGNQIYVVGGRVLAEVVRKCETFDVTKARWAQLPDFDEFG